MLDPSAKVGATTSAAALMNLPRIVLVGNHAGGLFLHRSLACAIPRRRHRGCVALRIRNDELTRELSDIFDSITDYIERTGRVSSLEISRKTHIFTTGGKVELSRVYNF